MSAEPSAIDALLARARRVLDRVEPRQLADEVTAGALMVDMRPAEQRQRDGELPGAIVIDRNVLEWRLDPSSPHRRADIDLDVDSRVILVCNEGYSSSLAAATLRELGLRRATDLVGGYQAWLSRDRTAEPDPWTERPPDNPGAGG
ncbi:MAG: rhodanese-like domain-containing protein [Marmoricola sp.]